MWLQQLQVHARHPLLEIMPVQKFLKLVEARECGHEVQRLAASCCRPRPHTYALENKCESSMIASMRTIHAKEGYVVFLMQCSPSLRSLTCASKLAFVVSLCRLALEGCSLRVRFHSSCGNG